MNDLSLFDQIRKLLLEDWPCDLPPIVAFTV